MSGTGKENRMIWGWALYDWANSAFATTVMAGFFPVFFNQYWSAGVDTTVSTARLGLGNSIVGITMALLAPILGAAADQGKAKKKFLLSFAFLGSLMTFCLYLVSGGEWFTALALYILASLGFAGGNIFYDALLVTVAGDKQMHSVSSLGYALGYLGGGILFALNVWMTLSPDRFGFADAGSAVKFSFVSVALWWALFSLPLILFVREPKGGGAKYGRDMIKAGWMELRHTFHEVRRLKTIFLFLLAYWCYIDGVDTIVRMAVDYGLSIGFRRNDLILALLITQFVGFPSALGFGFLGNRIGARRAIFISLAIYLSVSLWAAFMHHRFEFYLMAGIIGLVQGGIQALSRSFYAGIIPAERSAEYFGFYNMVGKFAAVIGPVLIGGFGLLVRSMGYGSGIATRASITSVALLFISGGILFYFVDEEKGKRELKALIR
ncbi:MAG: MFS transporter [Candidatus Krumholzibacteriota bacterium]|nr:MFS transporter [Candidatus Krumholzibacteriota bacterium]